ncbi:hypothetical protein GBAR_LOCUS28107, partial [Geodia barretti]
MFVHSSCVHTTYTFGSQSPPVSCVVLYNTHTNIRRTLHTLSVGQFFKRTEEPIQLQIFPVFGFTTTHTIN